jgi:AcrR family transcriptional regulator
MEADGDTSPRTHSLDGRVAEMQRARILDAMVQVAGERGFAHTSVGLVVARARVSRRTFYELFDGLEDCFMAVMDRATERAAAVVSRAFADQTDWRDGLRAALAAVLMLFEAEPLQTRVSQLEVLAAGSRALEHRERKFTELRNLILGRWTQEPDSQALVVRAEGVLASVMGLIQSRLIAGDERPLLELLGPLMGLVVAPFVDAKTRAREIERGEALARELLAERAISSTRRPDAPDELFPEGEIPAFLLNPRATRARLCVRYLATHSGSSNRQVAAGIGVADQGQISRLLGSLERGLLAAKKSHGPGRPNVWQLTPYGEEVLAHFALHEDD